MEPIVFLLMAALAPTDAALEQSRAVYAFDHPTDCIDTAQALNQQAGSAYYWCMPSESE